MIEKKLSFDRIREQISDKCSTSYAKNRVRTEAFSTKKEEIIFRLDLTNEMKEITMLESSFPDSGYVDCIPFLVPLEAENSFIDLVSLKKLQLSLDTLRRLVNFFSNTSEGKYPTLKQLTKSTILYPEIINRIESILDRFGEIKDSASEELRNIRREIRNHQGVIAKRINAILAKAKADGLVDDEASITMRDGRMLLPIAAGNKKKIQGVVYDESATGKTAFVEPLEVLELDNKVKELHFAEQREIVKILSEFSDFIRPYIPELIENSKYIGEIDFIRAKALYSATFAGGKPILSEHNDEIKLLKARHPLLEKALKKEGKAIVPLDITLNSNKRILLISGPNAGGKSVTLKTLGLLQYMFQWGTLIPASEVSEMSVFDNIFIDIGDNQSLDNDLSTYSSHLSNMREMLSFANEKSLILIDEFGAGTEPAAGGAIAEQILSELEHRNCYGVITTHYTNLKFYANNSNGVINGAMLFDTQNIAPFFKLEIGLPGNSFAFELARKMGLPEKIVKGAEERAGTEYVSIERNLRKIARNKRQLDEKLAKIKHTDRTLDSITEEYQKELVDIRALRKQIIAEAKKEAQDIVAEANKKIEATIKEIRESQAEKEKTKALRKGISDFTTKLDKNSDSEIDTKIEKKMAQLIARQKRQAERKNKKGEHSNKPAKKKEEVVDTLLKIGDKVKIVSNNLVGEVVQIDASGKSISIAVGDIISKMAPNKVAKISSNQFKEVSRKERTHSSINVSSLSDRKLNFKPSIDIRGHRLEEAIDIVTRFIDDAIMIGVGNIKILHGKGNGVLREEIRKYLKITTGVKKFYDESVQFGGSGITCIELE